MAINSELRAVILGRQHQNVFFTYIDVIFSAMGGLRKVITG